MQVSRLQRMQAVIKLSKPDDDCLSLFRAVFGQNWGQAARRTYIWSQPVKFRSNNSPTQSCLAALFMY
jgi:hypothetical protein